MQLRSRPWQGGARGYLPAKRPGHRVGDRARRFPFVRLRRVSGGIVAGCQSFQPWLREGAAAFITLKNTSVLSITPPNCEAPAPLAESGMSEAV